MHLISRNLGRAQSSTFARRSFAKEATKSRQHRLRPLTRDDRPIIQKHRKLNDEHEQLAEAMGLPFRVIGATVLHRYPMVSPDPPQWEVDYEKMKDKIENLNRAAFKEEVRGTKADIIPDENPSFEEIMSTLPFTPAPRETEADRTNDRSTINRKLTESLFLVVKRNRKDNAWQFPQGKWLEGETMRETSERIIDRSVGEVRRWFVSNAPIGHVCYAYPKEMQQQRKQYGAKVFFYRAQLIEGNMKLETRLYTDMAWISRDEVGEYFNEDMAEYMRELLPLV
mmetsp:Transcript_7409/g.12462  ORF Transcript_7409/g.12462 Transcript_7409/m.12462 type:complete len:282 (+) Transcript_7409:98-943(+)